MIKLTRSEKPANLTDEFVAKETERYKESVKVKRPISVWNIDWLKDSLLRSSFHKCAYCECRVNIEGSFMEVEHFKDKSDYPDDVLKWENLLPSCKRCNGKKSDHDVVEEAILNPYEDLPSNHLFLQDYRIKGKTELGKSTERVLYLNDTEKLVLKRFEIGNALHGKIEELGELIIQFENAQNKGVKNVITRRRNKLINTVTEILQLCQPEKEYAATCSTIVLQDKDFLYTLEYLRSKNLWNEELDHIYTKTKSCALLRDSS